MDGRLGHTYTTTCRTKKWLVFGECRLRGVDALVGGVQRKLVPAAVVSVLWLFLA